MSNNKELKYVRMDSSNIRDIVKVQMEIFPQECGYFQYDYGLTCGKDYWKYWLVYKDNEIVAITGLYSDFPISETNSIWLGWFGVREKYRNQGYGEKVLQFTIQEAKKLANKYPIKYFRLYTSLEENKIAQVLYNKVMDYKEKYNCPNDSNYDGTCLIWTKSLYGDPIIPWNNKCINLKEIEIEEKKYLQKFLDEEAKNGEI